MKLFADLEARGLVKQITDPELPKILERNNVTLYAGFDPTADSLHVGHFLPMLTLRRLQLAGHRPILVLGGATGMIGDPSGKSAERQLVSPEIIEQNAQSIKKSMEKIFDFDGKNGAILCNNADWFKGVSYIDFLRDIGKHFTVNHMVAKESVRARLEDREHGISYTEFSYMLLQAYDFYVLHKNHHCTLQIGGSDQWGNITAGCELIRRVAAAEQKKAPEVSGLTMPLVTKADGGKFGKTESGTVWLSAHRTSPYQLYQFFIQTGDQDVITYLKYFTFLDMQEIDQLAETVCKKKEKRIAQQRLAEEVVELIHGKDELQRAISSSQALFQGNLADLDEKSLLDLFAEAPSLEKPFDKIQAGYDILDALVDAGVVPSKGAARREIQGGGINLNNERVTQADLRLTVSNLIAKRYLVFRKGKKSYHLIRFV